MNPDSLRALRRVLEMGNQYALADIGEKDDRITEALGSLDAHANQWDDDLHSLGLAREDKVTQWLEISSLRKRLEAAEDEKRGMKRRWDMACDDNAALREAIDAMLRECGSEPDSRYARNACIIGAAALTSQTQESET